MTTNGNSRRSPIRCSAPSVGNLFDLDPHNVIESLERWRASMGRSTASEAPKVQIALDHRASSWWTSCATTPASTRRSGRASGRSAAGSQGLFTAMTDDPNWSKAHNILLPNFSLAAMQRYYPMMLDLAVQLRPEVGAPQPDDVIDVSGDHPPDAGHHRAVRVRLPLQLVLPRHTTPIRSGDGAGVAARSGFRPNSSRSRRAELAAPPPASNRTTPSSTRPLTTT
ncbi:MAG: hypothetical protein U0893_24055 [Chloroflexota bacterium]